MSDSDLLKVMAVSTSGLQAQSARMKVIAENIANAATTPSTPGEAPYQRKVVSFKNEFDRAMGVNKVVVDSVRRDNSEFIKKYDPSHPAADNQGYILTPNVKPVLESMDLKEAQRSYEANLNVLTTSRTMLQRTIELMSK